MALLLSVAFMALSLFYISVSKGLMAAFFVILSAIAFMNHTGGKGGPDDQRMA